MPALSLGGSHSDSVGAKLLKQFNVPSCEAFFAKQGIYAKADIGMYWIVNLPAQQLEVYSLPVNGAYTVSEVFSSVQTAKFSLADNLFTVLVQDLLP